MSPGHLTGPPGHPGRHLLEPRPQGGRQGGQGGGEVPPGGRSPYKPSSRPLSRVPVEVEEERWGVECEGGGAPTHRVRVSVVR